MFSSSNPSWSWVQALADARVAWSVTIMVLALPLAFMAWRLWKHREILVDRCKGYLASRPMDATSLGLLQRQIQELQHTLGQSWFERTLKQRRLKSALCIGQSATPLRHLLHDSPYGFAKQSGVYASELQTDSDSAQGFGWAKHGDLLVLGWVETMSPTPDATQEWSRLLNLTKRSRALRKLRFLVLNIEVQDLAKLSPADLQTQAQIWGERAHLTNLALGRLLPIYVVVHGIETLPGFSGYCKQIPLDTRKEPWGWHCPHAGTIEAQNQYVEQEQQRFIHSLMNEALMQGLQHEDPPKDLVKFAQAMQSLSHPLMHAIHGLLAYRFSNEPVPLRGLFFAGSNHKTPQTMYGQKGIFRAQLLEAFHNACPDAPDALWKHRRRNRRRKQLAIATAGAAMIAGCVLPWSAAKRNRLLQNQMQMVLSDVAASQSASVNIQAWARSFELDQSIASIRRSRSWAYRFGMGQATILEYGSRSLFLSLTTQWGVKPMLAQDIQRIQRLSQQEQLDLKQAQELQNRLFRYLLLSVPDKSPQPPLQGQTAHRLSQSLAGYWAKNHTFESSDQAKLIAQRFVKHLAENPELRHPRNARLVKQARHQLGQKDLLASFAHHAIKSYDRNHPPLSLESITGTKALQRSTRVSAAFTAKGWNQNLGPRFQNYLDRYLQEAWLFGYDRDTHARLRANAGLWLEATYTNAFKQAWMQALEDLRFQPFHEDLPSAYPDLFKHISNQLKVHTELKALSLDHPQSKTSTRNPISDLPRYFSPLIGFCAKAPQVGAESEPDNACQAYLRILHQLPSIRDSANQHGPKLDKFNALFLQIANISASQPKDWRAWFKTTLSAPVHQAKGEARAEYQQDQSMDWCELSSRLHSQVFDRYPFKRHATQEVELAALRALLHPTQGELWRFMQAHQSTGFEIRAGEIRSSQSSKLHPRLVKQLNSAWRVANTIFPEGARQPKISLLARVQATRDLSQLTLRLDHQVYKHPRKDPVELQWPGQGVTSTLRLSFGHPEGNLKIETHGTWSLFRLLESGDSQALRSPGTFVVDWPLGTHHPGQARLTLRVTDGPSPFFSYPQRPILSLFRSRWLQSRPPLFEQQLKCHS